MNSSERAPHNFEQDSKTTQERKRKAEYLKSIFENVEKKASKEARLTSNANSKSQQQQQQQQQTELPTTASRVSINGSSEQVNSSITGRISSEINGNRTSPGQRKVEQGSPTAAENSSKKARVNMSAAAQQQATAVGVNGNKAKESAVSQGMNRFSASDQRHPSPNREHSQKEGNLIENKVVVKQEKESSDSSTGVQIVSIQGSQEQPNTLRREAADTSGEVSDIYIKFLLFAGRLYRCSKVTDLTHTAMRFDPENIQNRKGKVVVLLMFHRTYREVICYVVGVVEHATAKDETMTIEVIKAQNYPGSVSSPNDADREELKFEIGAKKMLYNMHVLDGPIYGELVKILDGFGANSAVDYTKINDFNALINANADRFNGKLPHFNTSLALPFTRSLHYCSPSSTVAAPFTYLGPRLSMSSAGYNSSRSRESREAYSPYRAGSPVDRATSRASRAAELENDLRAFHASHGVRQSKSDQALYASAQSGVRVSPGSYNGHLNNSEHVRNGAPLSTTVHYHPGMRDEKIATERSLSSPRRSAQDLQTVAELCKEKMKRDMAEQELKSIRAAFEEFKSQMQHHLSQVEERMVLLEAENRNLKGKLSSMHQSNGYAEKKYHELRARLEELLKTV